jgi:CRISPR/Cas system CSM-associated protein Csm4 (group 5 of RAMP superfamily)
VSGGHHELSHHGQSPEKIEALKKIDHFYMQQLGYFLDKLKQTKDGGVSLLDRCMIMSGSGIGDGDKHNHDNLPVLLAGRAGGAWTPGRHIKLEQETPLCNLYVSMLHTLGVKAERFGDSTGALGKLKA